MGKSNNFVDNLEKIYMESIRTKQTINEQSGAKVYVLVHQSYQYEPQTIMGIYSSVEAAQQALDADTAAYADDDTARTRPRYADDDTDIPRGPDNSYFKIKEIVMDQPASWYLLD